MASSYRRDPKLDAHERQPGEPAEQFDWFAHWLSDRNRTCPRTAAKFDVSPSRVRTAHHKYDWQARLQERRDAMKAHAQTAVIEHVDATLPSLGQVAARMSALALTGDADRTAPHQATQALNQTLRMLFDAGALPNLSRDTAGATRDEYDAGHAMLEALEPFPEAKQAALDRLRRLDEEQGG